MKALVWDIRLQLSTILFGLAAELAPADSVFRRVMATAYIENFEELQGDHYCDYQDTTP
jgi:hypothetical protein